MAFTAQTMHFECHRSGFEWIKNILNNWFRHWRVSFRVVEFWINNHILQSIPSVIPNNIMDINQFKRTIEGHKNYNLNDICRCLLSSASYAKKEFRAQSSPHVERDFIAQI